MIALKNVDFPCFINIMINNWSLIISRLKSKSSICNQRKAVRYFPLEATNQRRSNDGDNNWDFYGPHNSCMDLMGVVSLSLVNQPAPGIPSLSPPSASRETPTPSSAFPITFAHFDSGECVMNLRAWRERERERWTKCDIEISQRIQRHIFASHEKDSPSPWMCVCVGKIEGEIRRKSPKKMLKPRTRIVAPENFFGSSYNQA